MACDAYRDLMMAYLDDELEPADRERFTAHLQTCPACAEAFAGFQRLKRITDSVTLAEPEDQIWENYWAQVYNRIERGTGWILVSIAAIGLLTYGGFLGIQALALSHRLTWALKALLLVLIAGLAILFVSVCRERLFLRRYDRYRDIRR